MTAAPLFTFTSHIAGKNARVSVYPDRIEWLKPRGVSAGKITAGILTGGATLLATGVKNGKSGTEMIPIKSITSVATRRDGLLNSFVSIITSGNTIDFRVSHSEAATVKTVVTDLMLGKTPGAPAATPAPATATPVAPDAAQQLQQLGALRDAGVLTEDEFAAKKTEILARM